MYSGKGSFVVTLTLFWAGCSDSEQNHAANKGKMAGQYQNFFPQTGIGLIVNNATIYRFKCGFLDFCTH